MRVRAHSRWHGRWVAVVVLAAALAAGCGGGAEQGAEPEQGGPAAEEKEMDQVTVQLDWLPRGNHGMFYVAKEKGWFAEQGIEVTEIQPGKGSAITMQIVGKNQADFGFGDLPTLAVARSQGIPVVALAAVNQESPLAMCTIESRHGLDNPEDLKGLRIGVTAGGSTFIFHQALLEANGLSRSDLKERSVTPPYESFLLEGHVDVVPCYIDAEVPILEAHAGEPLSILLGLDWGYDVLGSGLLTSEKMIDED
ncbi:MAG: ABC transporter substrate-binding protein, partial [Vicinamibacteria bacterium]